MQSTTNSPEKTVLNSVLPASILPALPLLHQMAWENSRKESWQCIFPDDYSQLFDNTQLVPQELDHLTTMGAMNRQQVTIKGVSILVGIFPAKNEIRVYSVKASRELFIVNEFQQRLDLELSPQMNQRFIALKEHLDRLTAIKPKHFPTEIERITHQENLYSHSKEIQTDVVTQETSLLMDKLIYFINDYKSSLFEKLTDYGLNLTANFGLIRVHLLKFLAILPSLDHDTQGIQVKKTLLEAFRRLIEDSYQAEQKGTKGQWRKIPSLVLVTCKIIFSSAKYCHPKLLARMVRFSVRVAAGRFIAGENIENAAASFGKLFQTDRNVTLDQLGELVVSKKEADEYMTGVIKLIQGFSLYIPQGQRNSVNINRAHVSIKVTALAQDIKPHSFEDFYEKAGPRLKKILLAAKQAQVFINIDAEHYHVRDLVLKAYAKVLTETTELHDFADTGIVIQAYLRDAYQHLMDVVELANDRQLNMPVRLVKGAYWDAESIEAEAHGFNAPQFINKEETDLHFRQLVVEILGQKHLQLCLASHNLIDHCFAEALRAKKFPRAPGIEHQCLHMTYEGLSTALAKMNWPTRNYVPIGSLIVGMGYLVRRIMENSSQVGVLTIMRSHKKINEQPNLQKEIEDKKLKGLVNRDSSQLSVASLFQNVDPLRPYLKSHFQAFHNDFKSFQSQLGQIDYSNNDYNGELHIIHSPSDHDLRVGKIKFANVEDTQKILNDLSQSQQALDWGQASAVIRSTFLLAAAQRMWVRRNIFASLIMFESGKTLPEALADVDEAIDFLNFYARDAVRIDKGTSGLLPRGIIAAICPWNFPLAIPCGMSMGALVTGNTVIIKSAEQTPLVVEMFTRLMHEVGVPTEVLKHLPGNGEEIGPTLVNSSMISGIVFTGSKAVGTWIYQQASKRIHFNPFTKQYHLVKVITEMGGKNAIIVTGNAELDETVAGIIYSVLGHAGQKCSACSRIIIDKSIKQKFIERFKEALNDIKIGKAHDFATSLNPLIGQEEVLTYKKRCKLAIEEANRCQGIVHFTNDKEDLPGNCVYPLFIELPKSQAHDRASFFHREMFAPAVHLIEVENLDEALQLFNVTEYALTGGIFSQSEDEIEYLSAKMKAGNIYVNRPNTGARVGIEPFGGFKMSGTGPKAGGKNYLRAFQTKTYKLSYRDQLNYFSKQESDTFDLCHSSFLGNESRKIRLIRALDLIIKNIDHMDETFSEKKKLVLKDYKRWISYHFLNYINDKHDNYFIPGQLSYDSFNLFRSQGVAIFRGASPEVETLLNVLSGIIVGAGLNIVTISKEAHAFWMLFLDLLRQAGFSIANVNVHRSSLDAAVKLFEQYHFDFLVLDGDLESYQAFIQSLAISSRGDSLTLLMHASDAPARNRFKRYLKQFILIRSFAVNIMRHGAPMGVES